MEEHGRNQPVALKEWAVTVNALAEGKLILVMRKGGISEETRDFQLRDHAFYLLPAYEHQRRELLKEAYRGELDRVLADWRPDAATVKLEAYAEAVDDILITDQETLDKLRGLHIWTDTFAEERLKWKRTKPLHVLLLRVYRLEEALEIPLTSAYMGCKSWVELKEATDRPAMKPVLDDETFAAEIDKIRAALDGSYASVD
ncbi:DUF1802 family protein [Paenibacillus beijingensis]|uniref:DUF1802 family protein n=1 Tax=Paenibacillus beijingensis TaxID=1126833 RepID=A0A0D5NKS5_9BACL|nr:DUF1802 family protein [Paenibacillus beijingensis]AJY75954.1 hypothetical protein VN24_17085 [Paenibacillus beijingensis]